MARSRRPVIGVPTQTLPAQPGELPACWVMSQRYVQVLRDAGAVPWLVPLMPDDWDTMREVYERLDGLFLTGGVDVGPEHYKAQREPYCGRTDADRDAVELQFLRWALEDDLPVLAVCRGLQVINVALGGTLYQDLARELPGSLRHDYFPTREWTDRGYLAHPVKVDRHTHLARALGSDVAPVNSMHHQAVRELAPGLRATAVAPDGVIEGVESDDERKFLVSVQWHPEDLTDTHPGMKALFTTFTGMAQAA